MQNIVKGVLEVTFIQYPGVHGVCAHHVHRQRNSTWTENKFIHKRHVKPKNAVEIDLRRKSPKTDEDYENRHTESNQTVNQFQRLAFISSSDTMEKTRPEISDAPAQEGIDYVSMAETIEGNTKSRTESLNSRNNGNDTSERRNSDNTHNIHHSENSTLTATTGYLDMTGSKKLNSIEAKYENGIPEAASGNPEGTLVICDIHHEADSTTEKDSPQTTQNGFDDESRRNSENHYTDTVIEIDSFSTGSGSDYNTIRSNDYNTIDSTSTRTTNSNYTRIDNIVDIDIDSENPSQTDDYLTPVEARAPTENEETVAPIPDSEGIYIATWECETNKARKSGFYTPCIINGDMQSMTTEQDDSMSEDGDTSVFFDEDNEALANKTDAGNGAAAIEEDEESYIDENSSPSVRSIIQSFQPDIKNMSTDDLFKKKHDYDTIKSVLAYQKYKSLERQKKKAKVGLNTPGTSNT